MCLVEPYLKRVIAGALHQTVHGAPALNLWGIATIRKTIATIRLLAYLNTRPRVWDTY